MRKELFYKTKKTLINNSSVPVNIRVFKNYQDTIVLTTLLPTNFKDYTLQPGEHLSVKVHQAIIVSVDEGYLTGTNSVSMWGPTSNIQLYPHKRKTPLMIIDYGAPTRMVIHDDIDLWSTSTYNIPIKFDIPSGTNMIETYCIIVPIITYNNYEESYNYFKVNLTSIDDTSTVFTLSGINLKPGDIVDVFVVYNQGRSMYVDPGIIIDYSRSTNASAEVSSFAYNSSTGESPLNRVYLGSTGELKISYSCSPFYSNALDGGSTTSILTDIDDLLDRLLSTNVLRTFVINDYVYKGDTIWSGFYNPYRLQFTNAYTLANKGGKTAGINIMHKEGKEFRGLTYKINALTSTSTSSGLGDIIIPGSGIGGGSNYLG